MEFKINNIIITELMMKSIEYLLLCVILGLSFSQIRNDIPSNIQFLVVFLIPVILMLINLYLAVKHYTNKKINITCQNLIYLIEIILITILLIQSYLIYSPIGIEAFLIIILLLTLHLLFLEISK